MNKERLNTSGNFNNFEDFQINQEGGIILVKLFIFQNTI